MSIFDAFLKDVRVQPQCIELFRDRVKTQRMHYLISSSLDDDFVRVINPSPNGPWICGGACLRWYQGQQITDNDADIDVYVVSYDQFNQIRDTMKKIKGATIITSTENAITYTIYNNNHLLKVQIITKFIAKKFTNVSDLLEEFDLSVCKIGFDGVEFHIASPHFHTDERQQLIRMDYPFKKGAFTRVIKYMAQGYTPIPGLYTDLVESDDAMEPLGDEYDA